MNNISQKEKAEQFRQLHYTGKMLVLPNIWDTLGALLLESLAYPAIATASASIAYTNGYNDGEKMPFKDLLLLLKRITCSVNIPVTADFESGYADNDFQLQENIKLLIDTGIAGINIEDTDNNTNTLLSIESQCNKIRLIRKISAETGIPLFINARTDVCFYEKDFSKPGAKLREIVQRGVAFKEAGADGFYPILLSQ